MKRGEEEGGEEGRESRVRGILDHGDVSGGKNGD